MSDAPLFDAVVIGAGLGGLAAASALRRAGRSVVVLEAEDRVGGTWRDNTYPGCACDVASHLYSLRDAPYAGWLRAYAPHDEILAYVDRAVTDLGLRPHLRLSTRATSATWGAGADGRLGWRVTTSTGGSLRARALVVAAGPLSVPKLPDVAGLDSFGGEVVHTARWRELPLDGKRVVVVGTGASAAQVIPAIAPRVGVLTVLQRTAPWVLPRHDHAYSAATRAALATVPGLRAALRAWIRARNELRMLALRNARWAERARPWLLRHLEREIADPGLRRALTPSFTVGCKRVILSDDYYATLRQPHVRLVPAGLAEVTPSGVVDAAGGRHDADVLVLATGFDVDPRVVLGRLDIEGPAGPLREAWAAGPRAHLGTTVPGFPNLFLLAGPHTGIGHTSLLLMEEAAADRVVASLDALDRAGAWWLMPREDVVRAFQAEMDAASAGTVWTSGCSSWYLGPDGRNMAIWPYTTWAFARRARRVDLDEHEVGGALEVA